MLNFMHKNVRFWMVLYVLKMRSQVTKSPRQDKNSFCTSLNNIDATKGSYDLQVPFGVVTSEVLKSDLNTYSFMTVMLQTVECRCCKLKKLKRKYGLVIFIHKKKNDYRLSSMFLF